MAGPVFWAAQDTTDVLRFYREFVIDSPDELGNVIRLGTIPPLPVVSEELHFRPATLTQTTRQAQRNWPSRSGWAVPSLTLAGDCNE